MRTPQRAGTPPNPHFPGRGTGGTAGEAEASEWQVVSTEETLACCRRGNRGPKRLACPQPLSDPSQAVRGVAPRGSQAGWGQGRNGVGGQCSFGKAFESRPLHSLCAFGEITVILPSRSLVCETKGCRPDNQADARAAASVLGLQEEAPPAGPGQRGRRASPHEPTQGGSHPGESRREQEACPRAVRAWAGVREAGPAGSTGRGTWAFPLPCLSAPCWAASGPPALPASSVYPGTGASPG